MSELQFKLRQLTGRMWFMPAVFSVVAVLTAVAAYFLTAFAPDELPLVMPTDAVRSILEILASSLLTVAVFALSTVVGALSSASSSTTPRAVPLITGDRAAQSTISIFIGAFLFSIVGIIGLSVGIYSEAGRLVLFLVTLAVVLLVVGALLRWIGLISAIGRVGQTIDAVEAATRKAVATLKEHPLFDGSEMQGEPEGVAVKSDETGYVQHFSADRLAELAEKHDLVCYVLARPGAYVTPLRPLLRVAGAMDEELAAQLRRCFSVADARTFDADPRFGLVVLGEIGDKAMSAAINDPGTAIDIIDTTTRVLLDWPEERASDEPYERVFVAPIEAADLIEDVFRPIARDGAHLIEIVQRLLRSLETLAACQPWLRRAALDFSADVVSRAEAALTAESDRRALARAAEFLSDKNDI